MRILVTNDDGIHAPGLKVCEEIALQLSDDVLVVAPEYDQSGVSHSLSLNDPLRLRKISDNQYAVKGTPTDCVIMGARHIMDRLPDLVLSGVNRGRNAAEDVLYSGTVAGAKEAAVLGIPAFALSQAFSRHHPEGVEGGHAARRAGQHQLPGLRAGRGERHRGVEPGQARSAASQG
jgi:5'-nucleotidase